MDTKNLSTSAVSRVGARIAALCLVVFSSGTLLALGAAAAGFPVFRSPPLGAAAAAAGAFLLAAAAYAGRRLALLPARMRAEIRSELETAL
ncbi:MAG TPA: hypothetical protein VLH39_03355, partial [Magnetospirillaceae bacterium]|nr:hypothetical protein [Magnetospirillaceae bacterium]